MNRFGLTLRLRDVSCVDVSLLGGLVCLCGGCAKVRSFLYTFNSLPHLAHTIRIRGLEYAIHETITYPYTLTSHAQLTSNPQTQSRLLVFTTTTRRHDISIAKEATYSTRHDA